MTICIGGPKHAQHVRYPLAQRLKGMAGGDYIRHDFVFVHGDWGARASVWGWEHLTDKQIRRGAEILNEWEWEPIDLPFDITRPPS